MAVKNANRPFRPAGAPNEDMRRHLWRRTTLAAGTVLTIGVLAFAIVRQPKLAPVFLMLIPALFVPEWFLLAGAALLTGSSLNSQLPLASSLGYADLLVFLWVARQLRRFSSAKRRSLDRSGQFLLAFLAWAWLATFLSGSSITALARLSTYAAIPLLGSPLADDRDKFTKAMVALAVLELAATTLRFGGALGDLVHPDPHQRGMLLLAALSIVLSEGWAKRKPLFSLVLTIVLVAGAFATGRRGVWLALAVLALIHRLHRIDLRRTVLAILLVAVVGALVAQPITQILGLNPDSLTLRVVSIQSGYRLGMSSALIGVGWAGVGDGTEPSETAFPPFNLWINVLRGLGIPGVILLSAYLLSVLSGAAQRPRTMLLFGSAFVMLSLSEMTLYAGSRLTLLFFAMSMIACTPRSRNCGGGNDVDGRRSETPRASQGRR